jgi:hypothetical protein
LCEALIALEASPWAEVNRGRPLTQHTLAKLLRPYRIASGTVRVGEKTPKGYAREAFDEPWRRYLCDEEQPATARRGDGKPQHRHNSQNSWGNGSQYPQQSSAVVTDADRRNPRTSATCGDVAVNGARAGPALLAEAAERGAAAAALGAVDAIEAAEAEAIRSVDSDGPTP